LCTAYGDEVDIDLAEWRRERLMGVSGEGTGKGDGGGVLATESAVPVLDV